MPAEKVRCACGCYVGKFYLNKHKTTKKHLKLMESISRPATMDDIFKAMSELEEKIDDMSSGEYLIKCNQLKSIYDALRRTDYLASLRVV
jgi:hypothetical protein